MEAAEIKRKLKQYNISQEVAAEACGLNAPLLNNVLNGNVVAKPETLHKLNRLLAVCGRAEKRIRRDLGG